MRGRHRQTGGVGREVFVSRRLKKTYRRYGVSERMRAPNTHLEYPLGKSLETKLRTEHCISLQVAPYGVYHYWLDDTNRSEHC